MAKKISIAWITKIVDFDNKEEAIKYYIKNKGKYRFQAFKDNPSDPEDYVNDFNADNDVWSVCYETSYKDYNPGW